MNRVAVQPELVRHGIIGARHSLSPVGGQFVSRACLFTLCHRSLNIVSCYFGTLNRGEVSS